MHTPDGYADILSHPPGRPAVDVADKQGLRKVLKSKLSRPIWIATFSNIPEDRRPPPCPDVLTEIEYVNLLYDRRCNVRDFLRVQPHMTD